MERDNDVASRFQQTSDIASELFFNSFAKECPLPAKLDGSVPVRPVNLITLLCAGRTFL